MPRCADLATMSKLPALRTELNSPCEELAPSGAT